MKPQSVATLMPQLKTFIFTDIVRSVALKNEMAGRDDMERDRAFIECVLTPHRDRIDIGLVENSGRIVSTAGDGHFLVFTDTIRAAMWAVNVQKSHQETPIKTPKGGRVEVRMSIHVGIPQLDPRDENNFVGKTVDYTARINDFAQGGQILVSRSVASMLDDAKIEGMSIYEHGKRELRGIGEVQVHELVYQTEGPQETIFLPGQHSERQWTVLPAQQASKPSRPQPEPASKQASFGQGSSDESQATALYSTTPNQLGNYELGSLLGSGGMGDVYLARHTQFGRTRAVKVIKQRFVDAGHHEVVRRFYQEIKAVGALQHRNIVVAVESSAPTDRVHFLVMEYIDGVALSDLVKQHGPLSVPDACEVARQAARGLAYIHKHGMVHRDIKPSNLMLTLTEVDSFRYDSGVIAPNHPTHDGVVKILDLGLALLTEEGEERLTMFNQQAMGTGMYMSPEQWKSTSVDIRADIYSLGCTLYHLLSGGPPFQQSDLKPEKAHEKSKIPQIEGEHKLPKKLWELLRKMLAKKPEDRFTAPDELSEALLPFCEGQNLVGLVEHYKDFAEQDTALTQTSPKSSGLVETMPLAGSTRPVKISRWKSLRRYWLAASLVLLVFASWGLYRTFLQSAPVTSTEQFPDAAMWTTTLPGLSGVGWFEESPWLFPAARVELLYQMNEEEWAELRSHSKQADVELFLAKLHTAQERPKKLLQSAKRPPPEFIGTAYDTLTPMLAKLDPLSRDAKSQIQSIVKVIEAISESQRKPVDWHLLGVLQAALHDRDAAKESLERASNDYRKLLDNNQTQQATKQIATGLLALSLSDLANATGLPSEKSPLYLQAKGTARNASAASFIVYNLGMESLARLQDPTQNRTDISSPLAEAEKLLDKHAFAQNHPLRAFIHERRAHYMLETWQLTEANEEAAKAAKIRDTFGRIQELNLTDNKNETTVQGYHFAQQAYFRAKQLQALAQHYQGDVMTRSGGGSDQVIPRAYNSFDRLLTILQQSQRLKLSPDQRIIWWSLMPNFLGRKADCELYLMGDFKKAANSMGDAITEAMELDWHKKPTKQQHLVFMHYKHVIMLSLAGELKRAEVVLKNADALAISRSRKTDKKGLLRVFTSVAKSTTMPEPERSKALVELLKTEVPKLDSRSRDNRQLLLFCTLYLNERLKAQKLEPEDETTTKEMDDLKRILVGPKKETADHREPYLKKPYIRLMRKSALKYFELQEE